MPSAPVVLPVRGCRPRQMAGYRMGRLERLSVTIATTVAVIGVIFGVFDTAQATSQVPVSAGDTVWSIAADIAGDRDVREVAAEILRLNSVSPTALQPGTVLTVPMPADR